MGTAIGSVLGLAAGVAVSPLPIVAMILLLASAHATASGTAFAAGWFVGLAILGTIVLVIAASASASSDGHAATWTGWVKLGLGVALLGYGLVQWQGHLKRPENAAPPRWMTTLDTLRPGRSFALGAGLATVNPKNAALAIAAAESIASAGLSVGGQTVSLAVFVLVSCIGVFAPLVVYLTGGDHAAHTLETWRAWFVANNAAIMAVLFFVLGLKLIGDGLQII